MLTHYRPLLNMAEVRLHDTPLYNSIYRFDNEMLVNVHAYGLRAVQSAHHHFQRLADARQSVRPL